MRPIPISLVAVLAVVSPACAVSSRGSAVMNRAPSTRRALVPATHRYLSFGTDAVVLGGLKAPSDPALNLPAVADGIAGPAPAAAQKSLRMLAAPVAFAGAKAASSMGRLGSVAPIIEASRASGNWSGVEGGLQALWGSEPPQASRGSSGSSSRCVGFCGTFRSNGLPGGGGGSSGGLPPGGRGGGSAPDGAREGPGLKLFFLKGVADYDRRVLTRVLRANHFRLERFLRRSFKLFPAPLGGLRLHVRSINHLTPETEAVIDAIEYTIWLRSGPGKKAKLYGHFMAKVNLRTGTLVLNRQGD